MKKKTSYPVLTAINKEKWRKYKMNTLLTIKEKNITENQIDSKKPTLYILNTTIAIPNYSPAQITMREITIDEAAETLNTTTHKIKSAIGHQATANVLSQLLQYPIPQNRIVASCDKNDKTLCFKLKNRLEEGKILTEEELKELEYTFWLMIYE